MTVMGLKTAVLARLDAKQARAAYFAAEEMVAANLDALVFCSQPGERHASLAAAAVHAATAANVFPAGFGADPNEDENGRDMAETLHHVATLYMLLAAVEESLTVGFCLVPFGDRDGLPESESALVEAAHGPLCEMASTPDLEARLRLMEKLYDTVEPIIGGQAAEAIWCLPGQGFVGWTTDAERDEWHAARGHGRPIQAARRFGTARRVLMNANLPYLLVAGIQTGWTAVHATTRLDYAFTAAFGVIAIVLTVRLVRDFTTFGPWLDLTERQEAEIDRLTAELDALRAERDALSPAEPGRSYLDRAAASFNDQAHAAFTAIGPPPGYGEIAAEVDEEIHAALSSPPPGWRQDTGEAK